MRTTTTATFVLIGALAFHVSSAQPGAPIAFTNVSVVPMDSNRVLADHTVVVTAGRVTALGPTVSTPVPEGAVRLEGRGKYLMPGLADMHGHIPPVTAAKTFVEDVLFLYVANGVTTVRGMQGSAGQLELRELTKRHDIIVPNLYLAGPPVNATSARTSQDAAALVLKLKTEGWDLLTVHRDLTPDAYNSMARAAKEVSMPFGGDVPSAVSVTHALEMGQHTVDHIDGYTKQLNGVTETIDGHALQDLVARTRQANAWIVPTLVGWETLHGPVTLSSRTSLPELRYMPRTTVHGWTSSLEARLNSPDFKPDQAKHYVENRLRILWELHAAGVGILLGSDASQPFSVPGFSIHHEMKRMTDAGMSTYEILRSGTSNVGQHFKLQDDFGTVAVGQRADLILLEGNPLADLANLGRRAGVMVRGQWLSQSEIDQRLDEIARRNQQPTP